LIEQHEIGMSRVLMEQGYDIYAFQFSEHENEKKHHSGQMVHGDISWPGRYFGFTLNPYEVLFIKTKIVNNEIVSTYTDYHNRQI
jgi:hypothetical protein